MDNSVECFRRACKFFNMEVKPLRVWDFSGQTTLLLLNDRNRILKEPQKQTEQDLLLELQVYGLTDEMCCGKISIMQIQHLKTMILHINKKKVLSRDTLSIKFDTEKRYTQMAKYVFPNRRFESRSFEEALLSVLDIETMETQVLKRNDQYEIIEVELQGHEERVIIISSKDRGNAFSNTENALPQIDSLILKDQETCIFLQCQPLTRCTVQMKFQWKEEKTVASQSRNPQLATVNGDSSFGDQQRSGLWFQLPTQGIKTYAQILSHSNFLLPIHIFVLVFYNSRRIFSIVEWLRSGMSKILHNEHTVNAGIYLFFNFGMFLISTALTMAFWLYGSETLSLGPNTSMLIEPNHLFVESIKVVDVNAAKGLMLYGFYKSPPLDAIITWPETHKTAIPFSTHKEWVYYLNEISQINISYSVTSLSSSSLLGKVIGVVETSGESFHRFDRYLNFSKPLISKTFSPRACGWVFGMNIFDLTERRKQNITEVYHKWQNLNHDRLLWKLGTLPPGLITFWNRTYALYKIISIITQVSP
ncbi:hypothetical protein ACS0TY_026868 [Phlomoides rotata]